MGKIESLDDALFKEKTAEGTVLVDFWASWCGPCKMLAPVLEQLDDELEGKAKIVKVEISEAAETAAEFNVQSVPTLVVLKDGVVVKRFTGMQNKKTLLEAMLNIQ